MRHSYFLLSFLFLLISGGCSSDNEMMPVPDQFENVPLLQEVRRNGMKYQEYLSDNEGRLVELKQYYDDQYSNSVFFEYNHKDQVVKTRDQWSETSYSYDNAGKLTKSITTYPSMVRTEKFIYKKEKLNESKVYFDSKLSLQAFYKYDSKGNTIQKKEVSGNTEMSRQEFKYGDKPHPASGYNLTHSDIIQKNNIIYSYYSSMIMSSIPVGRTFTYEVDSVGLPIQSYEVIPNNPDDIIYTYIYKR